MPTRKDKLISPTIYLVIFLVAFLPRVLALDAYVAPDEGKWIYRSAHFLQALLTGNLAQTTSVAATPEVEVLAPAVPTMWTGALGLVVKYWADGSRASTGLAAYLSTIPRQTEKIPLDFYPWTRFPTVLLTSLTIPVFYRLLLKLIGNREALLAALLLALDPFFIGLSRVIHHDALVSIFITISLLALLVYRQSGHRRRWFIISGASGGLALLTKPTALYLVIFVGLFLWYESEGGPPAFRRPVQRAFVLNTLMWGLIALLTFVAFWPAMWIAPVDTLSALFDRALNAVGGNNNYSLIPAPGNPLPELGFLFYPVNWLFKSTLPVWVGLIALALGRRQGRLRRQSPHPSADLPSVPALKWLTIFVLLFLLLLIPADTRDIRYFLPAIPALYALAAAGIIILTGRLSAVASATRFWFPGLLLAIQFGLTIIYYPYFVDYWNPLIGGPWLAPRLVKIGSGEGLDQMGRYLSRKPNAADLTVAVSFWESFVPFFPGRYTKPHYDEEADYIIIYRRQIQNRNPFPEYWTYFSMRNPEHKISLVGLDYVWLYPGPQLRVIRGAEFAAGLSARGYRLDNIAAQPGQPTTLTLVWSGAGASTAQQSVTIKLMDAANYVWAQTYGPILDPAGPSPVEGHYRLDIPADMPRGDYALWVSIGDVSRRVGTIPVRVLQKPPVQIPASTNFGNLITFGGADIAIASNRTLQIKL
ncbi:MAG: phospholipid carrier-dependent glycosyltransferase, partial [Chloroflexi bacterium]